MSGETPGSCVLEAEQISLVKAYANRFNVCSGFGAVALQTPDNNDMNRWQETAEQCTACANRSDECLPKILLNKLQAAGMEQE